MLKGISQSTKDWIATNIMRLCLLEIKEFKFMQTDGLISYITKRPIKSNYDFGAARDFGDHFIDNYVKLLRAAVKRP